MKRVIALLASASALLAGPAASAQQTKIGLQDAIANLLGNGCQSLVSASDLQPTTPIITRSAPRVTALAVAPAVDSVVQVAGTTLYAGLYNSNGARYQTGDGRQYADPWAIPALATTVTPTLIYSANTDAISATVTANLPGVAENSGGARLDSAGNLFVDPANQTLGLVSPVAAAGQNLDIYPGYRPVLRVPDSFDPSGFRDIQANNLVVTISVARDREIVNQRNVLVGQGHFGQGLAQLCSAKLTVRETVTQQLTANAGFNNVAGPVTASAPMMSFSTPPTQPVSPAVTGVGVSSTQSQEGLVRRQKDSLESAERLKAKDKARKSGALRGVQVASNDPSFAPAYGDARAIRLVTDAYVGAVNVDRSATVLEGAYSADSIIGSIGAGVAIDGLFFDLDQILVGFNAGYESTEASSEPTTSSSRFDSKVDAWTASVFSSWTSPPISLGFTDPARISATLVGLHGEGDRAYDRVGTAEYRPELNAAVSTQVISVLDQISGSAKNTFDSLSAHLALSQAIGPLTLIPRASVVRSETHFDSHAEEDAGGGGLALRYDPADDDWTEMRVGGEARLNLFTGGNTTLTVGAGIDAVFVGDPESERRTAFFEQDLRAAPLAIVYDVDDLDDQYYDISASIALGFNEGAEVFLSAFSRQDHAYIEANGAVLGLRSRF